MLPLLPKNVPYKYSYDLDPKLYTILKNGYRFARGEDIVEIPGYILDSLLSNHNQQVYYNPSSKHLLYNINGTHNISDIWTDYRLLEGFLKSTGRYQEAHHLLRQAKEKYRPENTHIYGHSLGGAIAGYIAPSTDQVTTVNKGATIGQSIRPNETALRFENDIPSLLTLTNPHMVTLPVSDPLGDEAHFWDHILHVHSLERLVPFLDNKSKDNISLEEQQML